KALEQMRNRGNGKGGGIAAVGLSPEQFGVSQEVLERDYLISIAYLDPAIRSEVEKSFIEPMFEVDHTREVPHMTDHSFEVTPPAVHQYFVRVKPAAVSNFAKSLAIDEPLDTTSLEDEIVYQNCYRLNQTYYASGRDQRAFVL